MKIDIKENSKGNTDKMSNYPADSIYTGQYSDPKDLKVFIKQETLASIDSYLRSDTNNELGGVLVGDVCLNEDNKRFIKIDNLIIAKHSSSSISRLTFTHDTWVYINEVLEKDFPDKKILGWFHSHPGHTVFLSNFDIFIQENFFNMEYMVAYVYDPTINDRGFFFWKDKKIVKSNGYNVYGISETHEVYNPDKIDNAEVLHEVKDVVKKKTFTLNSNLKFNIILAVLLANLLILLLMIYNYVDLKKNSLQKDELARELTDMKTENEKLKNRLDNFIVEYELQSGGVTSETKSENLSVTKKTDEIKKAEEPDFTQNKVIKEIIKYTVKAGDSLDKIAREFYKNKAGIEIVMKQNNLKNKSDIKIGQILEIPQYNE